MTESQYTQAVHKKLAPEVFKWKIRDDYQGGVPDAYYRRNDGLPGPTLWIEYKYLKALPKRDTTLVVPDLSEQQKRWLGFAQAAGDLVAVVLGVGNKGVWLTLDEALDGVPSGELRHRLRDYGVIAGLIKQAVATEEIKK
ncbi:hypothetical protein HNR62_000352 [Oceanisphaera litoralis]|uniref:hypothetical protein n=1 Tax=Oceanisphaera litoralis TaxID=225144 RepID=UPI00195B20BD|nr:hypothetical protein [Oceanisphaera litoralis]MBM7454523.1 hypothetical protein [Oceanisphaera litoralis]